MNLLNICLNVRAYFSDRFLSYYQNLGKTSHKILCPGVLVSELWCSEFLTIWNLTNKCMYWDIFRYLSLKVHTRWGWNILTVTSKGGKFTSQGKNKYVLYLFQWTLPLIRQTITVHHNKEMKVIFYSFSRYKHVDITRANKSCFKSTRLRVKSVYSCKFKECWDTCPWK